MKQVILLVLVALWIIGCSKDDSDNAPYVPNGSTITSRSVYGPGMSFTYGEVFNPVAYDVDSAGPNRTWRFNQATWSDYFSFTYCAPNQCPFGAQFPASTRGVQISYASSPGGAFYLFEKVDTHGIWDLGYSNQVEYDVFDELTCRLKLPCEYGTQWTYAEWDSSGNSDFRWWSVDSTIWTCDAWGTIVTPYDSCRVLRGSEYHCSWYKSPYDSVPRQDYVDVNYYWIDEYGDIVAWTSAAQSTANPYYNYGYLNLRTEKQAVSAPAVMSPQNPDKAPQARSSHFLPRTKMSFVGRGPVR